MRPADRGGIITEDRHMKAFNICVICRKTFSEWPNNPWPVKLNGVCCAKCDDLHVTPARMVRRGMDPTTAKILGQIAHDGANRLRKHLQ
jgi:hypothetical protein